MQFESLKKYIVDFPNFQIECEKLIDKGYESYNCTINVSSMENTAIISLRVLLKNLDGKRICITQRKRVNEKEEFEQVKTMVVSIQTRIKLSTSVIVNEMFKKSFKGYDCEEVDTFLDLVAEDYDRIEKLINVSKLNEVTEMEQFDLVEKEIASNKYNNHFIVKLSELEVANKEFNKSFRGYNCDEVDRFFYLIVEDYNQFKKMLTEFEE